MTPRVKSITVVRHPGVSDDLACTRLTDQQLRVAGGATLARRLEQLDGVTFHVGMTCFFALEGTTLTGPYPTLAAAVDDTLHRKGLPGREVALGHGGSV